MTYLIQGTAFAALDDAALEYASVVINTADVDPNVYGDWAAPEIVAESEREWAEDGDTLAGIPADDVPEFRRLLIRHLARKIDDRNANDWGRWGHAYTQR
jgi:hypothetical protein